MRSTKIRLFLKLKEILRENSSYRLSRLPGKYIHTSVWKEYTLPANGVCIYLKYKEFIGFIK